MADNKSWRKLFESEDVRKTLDPSAAVRLAKTLDHTKAGLEKLLSVAVVELEFSPADGGERKSLFCTGNVRLMNAMSKARPADKKKQLATPFVGLTTRDSKSVDVYDLVERKRKTVSIRAWKIVLPYVLLITEKNVLLLDSVVSKYLKG